MSTTLAELLARTRYLLLDFDGPICAIFAGRPARTVVAELLELLAHRAVDVPPELTMTRDPFDILRYAAGIGPELAEEVERVLTAAELDAVRTATPTPHATDVICRWHHADRHVAVVSNNSAATIDAYLAAHQIDVDATAARSSADPRLLKPHPHLVLQAIAELHADPDATTLVGDSVSDVAAAHAAGIASIGYANKPGKHNALATAGAHVVIERITSLAAAPAPTR